MIVLTEVANRIERILNNKEDGFTNPLSGPYEFVVATEGFHIDSIANKTKDGNFIPVFVSSLGGQFNPVKGLKQGSYSIPITFYYPVRFKDDFFLLGEFLEDTFVGNKIRYGSVSGTAISNISVPQYGEIQDLDFQEFKKWVAAQYTRTIEKMEPYMSMQVTLYLSNAAEGLKFGNDINISFSFSYNGKTYTANNISFDGASLQSNSQTQSEQEEQTNEADSLPFGTAYGSSFKIYPDFFLETEEISHYVPDYTGTGNYYRKSGDDYIFVGHFTTPAQYNAALEQYSVQVLYKSYYYKFYEELLKVWLAGNIQELECDLEIDFGGGLKYTRKCFIQSIVAPIEIGQLLSLTLTFAKKAELED